MEDEVTHGRDVIGKIWWDVLPARIEDPDENFFLLGGDSLAATTIITRIRALLGKEVDLADLFAAGSLRAFTQQVLGARRVDDGEQRLDRIDCGGDLRASVTQEWQFILGEDPSQEHTAPFLIHAARRVRGALDVSLLRRALGLVAERHELLRTAFQRDGDLVLQRIAPAPATLPLTEVVVGDDLPDPLSTVMDLVEEEVSIQFDRTSAPLARGIIYTVSEMDHVLLMIFDHLICDGISLAIFMQDLAAAYSGLKADPGYRLEPLEFQFADWAHWQRHRLEGPEQEAMVAYWREVLGPDPRKLVTRFRDYLQPQVEKPYSEIGRANV